MYYMIVYWDKEEGKTDTFNKYDDFTDEFVKQKFEEMKADSKFEDVQLVIVVDGYLI